MRNNSVFATLTPFRFVVLALMLLSLIDVSVGVYAQNDSDLNSSSSGTAVAVADDAFAEKIQATFESTETGKPETFGWIEQVILSPELQWKLDAKLDTGADTSSLDAHKIRRVRYKGKRFVRFSIKNPETGEMVSLRRPYVRTVRIRRHSGNHQRRQVVLMSVCIGQSLRTIEVTLTGREFFDYPMLLGRSALSGIAVVDPMSTYTKEPDCSSQFGETMLLEQETAKASEESKPRQATEQNTTDNPSIVPSDEDGKAPTDEPTTDTTATMQDTRASREFYSDLPAVMCLNGAGYIKGDNNGYS